MENKKTFRDFYNQVITEAGKNPDEYTKQQIEGIGKGVGQLLDKALKRKKYDESQIKDMMVAYAKGFVAEYPDQWINFIKTLSAECADKGQFIDKNDKKKGIICTKFQFMHTFFKYYFEVVFKFARVLRTKPVRKCLQKAAETIEMDKDYYSKRAVNAIYKTIKKSEKNKKVFIRVFNSLSGGDF